VWTWPKGTKNVQQRCTVRMQQNRLLKSSHLLILGRSLCTRSMPWFRRCIFFFFCPNIKSRYLQVLVGYLQYICDIERAMLSTAWFIHDLSVHVTCRGHDYNDVFPLLIEKECSIPDLGTWEQEVVHGAQGIHWQVIDLWPKETKSITPSWIYLQNIKRLTIIVMGIGPVTIFSN